MYSYLVASEKSDFIDYFTEHTKQEYPELSDEVIKADAEAMWNEKPVFLEDLGIDHITVDEMHNFKNVFTSAKMQEDEN
jgi:N12 class adenine-specific DNA methylase